MQSKISRRSVVSSFGLIGVGSIAGCLGAEGGEDFPSETIEFMIPNPPGGGNDTYVRSLSPALSTVLDVDVNPVNETPLEQTLPELYNSDADGHNISIVSPTLLSSFIVEDGPDTPLNPANWHSLGAPASESLILVITSERDIQTWDELVEMSEGGESFTTAQIGIGLGMFYDLIEENSPADFTAVTGYEGTGPVIGDLKRGDVDLFIGPAASLLPFVADDTVDPVLTNEPDVFPESLLDNYADIGHEGIAETSFAEAGMEEVATLVRSIRAIVAPPSVPEDRVTTLQEGVWDASNSDEFKQRAEEANIPVKPMRASELQELLERKEELLLS